ncbi:MAG TPA: prenyltransferase [Planctomycetes bacterium]|nr:prenyltransferase [Planctomycetota bacterium]
MNCALAAVFACRLLLGAGAPAPAAEAEGRLLLAGYLESLARPDGGYGWADQPDSHLTPTFAVIGCYRLLGKDAPGKAELARYVRTHHPITGAGAEAGIHAAELRSFVYEQIQSLLWLGEDARSFASQVRAWTRVSSYAKSYERSGFPILRQEAMAFICRGLLGLPLADLSPDLTAYLDSRRRPDGSYNNTPAADGTEGNVLNTFWAQWALMLVRPGDPRAPETAEWLRSCQRPSGGFSHAPDPAIGASEDAVYTWAAVLALKRLGRKPLRRDACVRYLLSLRNAGSGFGFRPGLPSDPVATYHALAALDALNALDGIDAAPPPTREAAALPEGLKTYTIQLQAQGCGSPAEAVELARALRIHLWGAKNSTPGWIAGAQALARERAVPVTFFVSDEEYGTFVSLPGLGAYSHVADPCAPAGIDFGRSMAGPRDVPWPRYREHRIGPLLAARGVMVWQICDNEEFSRVLLGDSAARGGYGAISTFHHPQNFAYMLPFLFRYRDELPFVALQDAHGPEAWWWADELTGYRTLFLAREPSWDGWLDALKHNRVVAVRHDRVTGFRTRLLGGAAGVQAFVARHEAEWRWWNERPEALRRPWASLVALTPGDALEEGRPERGAALRLRCWCSGRMKREKPVAELVRLTLDGAEVRPRLVEKRDRSALIDCYHHVLLPEPAAGRHTAAALVRLIGTENTHEYRIEFDCP